MKMPKKSFSFENQLNSKQDYVHNFYCFINSFDTNCIKMTKQCCDLKTLK